MIWYVLKIKMFRGKWWIILIFPQRVVDLKLYKKLYNCKRTQLMMDTLYMFIVLFHKMRNYLNTNMLLHVKRDRKCVTFIPTWIWKQWHVNASSVKEQTILLPDVIDSV